MTTVSRSGVRGCCIVAAVIIVTACAAQHPHSSAAGCDIRIGGSILRVAAHNGFPYHDTVSSACRGESKALMRLLLFTDETDGEAMLDHGNVLVALRLHVGAARFDNALQSLDAERQRRIDAILKAAEKMHRAVRQILGSDDRS